MEEHYVCDQGIVTVTNVTHISYIFFSAVKYDNCVTQYLATLQTMKTFNTELYDIHTLRINK